jgi:hypothetical protein
MGGGENALTLLVAKPEAKPPGRPRCGWMLSWILEKEDEVVWTGLVSLRIGTSESLL